MGFWVEIVTLLIKGFNDSDDELKGLAEFIAGVSADIPWHVTAFHKDYKMTDPSDTTPEMLKHAVEIGRAAGLHFVYAGNIPGRVGELENTRCPGCGETLIERYGYHISNYRITPKGRCPSCNAAIAGRWSERFEGQLASSPYLPYFRQRGAQLTTLD